MKYNTAFVSVISVAILSSAIICVFTAPINYCLLTVAFVRSEEDVTFAVRTRQKRNNQDFRSPMDHSEINPNLPFKFIIHGWIDWGNNSWIQNLSYAFLDLDNYNIIAVNWHNLAQENYLAAAQATRGVGKVIAKEIIGLHNKRGVSFRNVHVIGHSLGAHIAGFTGKEVFKSTRSKIYWITGLDPAGPLFEVPLQNKMNRLSDQDATFVEILHTDGGVLGFLTPLGTSDFFPNGGKFIQPKCNFNLKNLTEAFGCSHMMCTSLYTEAVRRRGVAATKCISWEVYKSGQCKRGEKEKYGAIEPPKLKGEFFNTA